jgi:methionyl aminopeptidase
MIIETEDELLKLKEIGRICANAIQIMASSMEPGITTQELDDIGRKVLESAGARSAPEFCYQFPGATCIIVNIDVSAEKDGFFSDTGASFVVPPSKSKLDKLCRDGKRALWVGLNQVKSGEPLAKIGQAIGAFAAKNRYTLVANLASHGVGRSLHEEPGELSTWPDPSEKRIMTDGLVFTVEPFLSLGATWAEGGDDAWTLYADPQAPTVQYEHTVVATRNGPMILTLPDGQA